MSRLQHTDFASSLSNMVLTSGKHVATGLPAMPAMHQASAHLLEFVRVFEIYVSNYKDFVKRLGGDDTGLEPEILDHLSKAKLLMRQQFADVMVCEDTVSADLIESPVYPRRIGGAA